ncbi:hypothetical protein MRB53_041543 [Persea americana]|nr:hypothetical protein MRB53_041543 [Persea americana]
MSSSGCSRPLCELSRFTHGCSIARPQLPPGDITSTTPHASRPRPRSPVTYSCLKHVLMSAIQVRKPFAGECKSLTPARTFILLTPACATAAFAGLLLGAAYLGLSTPKIPSYGHSDKGLHFVTFFVLTVRPPSDYVLSSGLACTPLTSGLQIAFYWILETSRRRLIHLTLVICTAGLGIGSEFAQAALPNDRDFDPYDILANVVGSALALFLCSWYHKRMLERRRKNRHYDIVPGETDAELGDDPDRDVELGEAPALRQQESGIIYASETNDTKATDVTEELDNWDENAEDWDDGAEGTWMPASRANPTSPPSARASLSGTLQQERCGRGEGGTPRKAAHLTNKTCVTSVHFKASHNIGLYGSAFLDASLRCRDLMLDR